ncbi:MAG: GMC family oxidoreductase [Gammaproteobacteria bacterium]|nr:GMC family oxidoreductase [Gammaproteobacteria bacterium]MYG11800.1 GMC family oxidoreductase [Gammaproteobacteria bacterium]MYK29707.1 GMC family oxidoreductase [Gammaproteobacteria bacterium]
MLTDFAQARAPRTAQADVCIIGAGAAGITLARGLSGQGLRILLLESGGLDYGPESAALGVGENIGAAYYPLEDSRLRFFGGTTNIWGGRCAPLDDIDFQARGWVAHSGWPIDGGELAEGYSAAHRDLGVGAPDSGAKEEGQWGAAALSLDADRFMSRCWRFDTQRERFHAKRTQDVLKAPDIETLINATAVGIRAHPNRSGLDHVLVRHAGGQAAKIKANSYVLACGGIENARLLLASNDVEPLGIGNGHDQVGRFFMEHPHGRLGRIRTRNPYRLWNAFRMRFPQGSVPVAPVLLPTPALQRERDILNTALTFKWQRNPAAGVPRARQVYQALKHQLAPGRGNRQLWHAYRGLRFAYARSLRPLLTRGLMQLQDFQLSVMIRAEQAPNPASRVVLSTAKDELGCPKANLDWRLGEQDKHTLRELARALNDELVRLDLGALEPSPWLEEPSLDWPVDGTVGNHPIGGYHHAGTTRMSASPTNGVVDRNCAVHGYHDLYILGSSVFPTAGWANPTLTILALAHRLKAHLLAKRTADHHQVK